MKGHRCNVGSGQEKIMASKIKKGGKGSEGKGTGTRTRSAIKAAQKRGNSLGQIGRAAGRDADTISAILSGKIKNPPASVAAAAKKLPSRKKKTAPAKRKTSKTKTHKR